jgi:hypothetical protein
MLGRQRDNNGSVFRSLALVDRRGQMGCIRRRHSARTPTSILGLWRNGWSKGSDNPLSSSGTPDWSLAAFGGSSVSSVRNRSREGYPLAICSSCIRSARREVQSGTAVAARAARGLGRSLPRETRLYEGCVSAWTIGRRSGVKLPAPIDMREAPNQIIEMLAKELIPATPGPAIPRDRPARGQVSEEHRLGWA